MCQTRKNNFQDASLTNKMKQWTVPPQDGWIWKHRWLRKEIWQRQTCMLIKHWPFHRSFALFLFISPFSLLPGTTLLSCFTAPTSASEFSCKFRLVFIFIWNGCLLGTLKESLHHRNYGNEKARGSVRQNYRFWRSHLSTQSWAEWFGNTMLTNLWKTWSQNCITGGLDSAQIFVALNLNVRLFRSDRNFWIVVCLADICSICAWLKITYSILSHSSISGLKLLLTILCKAQ